MTSLVITILLLILGIILIVKGGDMFVDAASWMAEVSGIPKLIVGATVVSLATTLPELLVSAIAASKGQVDMAIGNAVGSVTANIGLIMGVALLFMPTVIKRKDYLLKSMLMLSGALVLVVFGLKGSIGVVPSVILFLLFALNIYDSVHNATLAMKAARDSDDDNDDDDERVVTSRKTIRVKLLQFLIGAAGIVIGADLLVDNGSLLAAEIGVPERIIGVTVIAIGTSLPELVTTVTAIIKKESSLSFGNIIGANIIDLTMILPICTLISRQSLPLAHQSAVLDLPACLLVGVIAIFPTLITKKFSRWQGVVLLCVYAVYLLFTTGVLAVPVAL